MDPIAQMRRLIEDADVQCWAGCPAHAGQGVLCRIEGQVIDARSNPHPIEAFCLGDPERCPTWRADKDRIAAGFLEDLFHVDQRGVAQQRDELAEALTVGGREHWMPR